MLGLPVEPLAPGRPFFVSGVPVGFALQEPPFFIRSRPLFIRLPVLAPRGMQEFLFRGTFVSHGLSA